MIPGIHHQNQSRTYTAPHHARAKTTAVHRHYIFEASVISVEEPTLRIVFTPADPRLTIPVSNGDIVAIIQVLWSDGSPFTGSFGFAAPNFDHDGDYAISGNNLIVNNADNLNSLGETTVEHVTIEATQS